MFLDIINSPGGHTEEGDTNVGEIALNQEEVVEPAAEIFGPAIQLLDAAGHFGDVITSYSIHYTKLYDFTIPTT